MIYFKLSISFLFFCKLRLKLINLRVSEIHKCDDLLMIFFFYMFHLVPRNKSWNIRKVETFYFFFYRPYILFTKLYKTTKINLRPAMIYMLTTEQVHHLTYDSLI